MNDPKRLKITDVINKLIEIRNEHGEDVYVAAYPYDGQASIPYLYEDDLLVNKQDDEDLEILWIGAF